MANERNENGTCQCSRSPTGDCVGWHMLTPEEYEAKTDDDKEAMFEDSEQLNSYNCLITPLIFKGGN